MNAIAWGIAKNSHLLVMLVVFFFYTANAKSTSTELDSDDAASQSPPKEHRRTIEGPSALTNINKKCVVNGTV